jgi:hypothetical protein
MGGLCLIDSSFLVSLAKIKRTELLRQEKLKNQLVTLEEVYKETVLDGLTFGYQDAHLIEGLFEQKVLEVIKIPARVKVIQKVDDRLVWAFKTKKTIKCGYVDDEKLGNKMKLTGKPVLNSIDFMNWTFRGGLLSKEDVVKAMLDLHEKGRISQEALKRALSLLNLQP